MTYFSAWGIGAAGGCGYRLRFLADVHRRGNNIKELPVSNPGKNLFSFYTTKTRRCQTTPPNKITEITNMQNSISTSTIGPASQQKRTGNMSCSHCLGTRFYTSGYSKEKKKKKTPPSRKEGNPQTAARQELA